MIEASFPALLGMSLAAAIVSRDIPALFAEYDELAADGEALWPGFRPDEVPLLIFDGEHTWLRGHPAPPPEFAAVDGTPGLARASGRHAAMRANTSIELAGEWTASLDSTGGRSARDLAGVAIHEAFHVYQSARHPEWNANELDLLTIPFDDAGALAARRIETELLRLALERSGAERVLFARRACAERATRAASGSLAYERGIELKEGLAQYVQHRALGEPPDSLPELGFAAEDLRERGYDVGEAWATLLDAFAPWPQGWKAKLEAGAPSLDELLAAALEERFGSAPLPAYPDQELAAIRERAARDAQRVAAERGADRAAFLGAAGWTLEILATAPLLPSGFDPMNVRALGGGAVLHRRWIALSNDAGKVEVLGRAALTESHGEHPLFQGVQRLLVTGLDEEPKLAASDGALTFEQAGVTLRLAGASAESEPATRVVRVTLPAR